MSMKLRNDRLSVIMGVGLLGFVAGCPLTGGVDGDRDGDGVADAVDNCVSLSNANQVDSDDDGVGDDCDLCPDDTDATNADADNDGIGDLCDNCPAAANENQEDADGNGVGDACEGGDAGPPAAFTNADAARGGAMYDEFWAVAGVTADEPADDHPFWASRPDTVSNTRSGAGTWRCKECHGWDYKGVDGAYSSGGHRTGIAGIFGTTLSAQGAFDLIKTDHGYGEAGLSDEDIWDLAKFVLDGQIDTDEIIDATGGFIGNVTTGQTLYDAGISGNLACAICHGADGTQLLFDNGTVTLGGLANDNPWEVQHKVRFGQPGTAMPSSVAVGGTTQEVADLGAYVQTLPQVP